MIAVHNCLFSGLESSQSRLMFNTRPVLLIKKKIPYTSSELCLSAALLLALKKVPYTESRMK
jgi:hypothetical protein